MSELFLFVRPPRPLWPFNGQGTAFWPPLAFASMAAALRQSIPTLQVAILDAPALKMGWKTLTSELCRLRPTYIGIGEESVSCVEGLRLASIAKSCASTVIAGGCFFGNVAREAISTKLVDVVVHGEGEETIVEVIQRLRDSNKEALRDVRGLSFFEGNEIVFTGHREPICDLDSLPFPAYDLLPMERYSAGSRNHPGLVSIELSRGCTHECDFCVLWRQMGHHVSGRFSAHLRTKSPERVIEEIRICTTRYNRRYLGWVDPCFNAHPRLPQQVAELLLSGGYRLGQSAWVRADYLRRDLASGALDTCIRAGLNELYIGLERHTESELTRINKGLSRTEAGEALETIASRYPQVCTVGSFIYDMPGESRESLRSLFRYASGLPLDITLFIPMTPLPGTPTWTPDSWDASGRTFRAHDFLPRGTSLWSQDLHNRLLRYFLLYWPTTRLRAFFRGLRHGTARRRRIVFSFFLRIIKFVLRTSAGKHTRMQIPAWYED